MPALPHGAPRKGIRGELLSFPVKHSEAREYSPKARDFPRINPRLFAKGPRRRQIKERGPRGPVLKYLIWRDFSRFVVPKAREP